MYVQVKSHAYGVARHQVVIVIVRVVEETGLVCTRLRRQAAIDDGHISLRLLLDPPPHMMYTDDAKANDAVTGTETAQIAIQALLVHG